MPRSAKDIQLTELKDTILKDKINGLSAENH